MQFSKKNKILGIIIGILVIGIIYNSGKENPKCLVPSEVIVTKVIDGDTVIVEEGYHIRLLGIDADEKGYPCYESAKKLLEKLVLGKKVKLEKGIRDVDQYHRCLRYIFLNNQNINLQLVKEGEAVCRFYEPDIKYRKECANLEKEAIEKKIGCKWGEQKSLSPQPEVKFEKLTSEKTNLKIIPACKARNYYGEEVIIEGKIVDTYRSKAVFLNFEKPYPNQCFTALIFSSDQHKFVEYPEKYYLDKIVRVKGKIKEYQGKPEIVLEDPSQIEVGEILQN